MRRNWVLSSLVAVALFGLVWGVKAGALWDPHEVAVAELGRRIALNLFGAQGLALPGADNSVPIRADLGRGELPFTSVALGFRLFGLSDWAGRLPLALWSLLGLGALYGALTRLCDRRAALYGVLVLATTPLYFLQARTLLGDGVTLATFAIAWSGLAVAALAPEQTVQSRLGFAALGAFGLYAGFWCRGPLVNVAAPAGAVGLAALLAGPATSRLARGIGVASLLTGMSALGLGAVALSVEREAGQYSVWVGSALGVLAELPTFETPLAALAHACFPWSAAAPLAIAVLWRAPDLADEGDATRATTAAAGLGLGASLAVCAWLAPTQGGPVVAGVVCLAALTAIALRELERTSFDLSSIALVVAALSLVIGFDLRVYPEKALAAFGLLGVTLPEALEPTAHRLWTLSALGLAFVVLFCLYDRGPSKARRFERAEYERVLTRFQQLWDGNLVFALLVVEAALVGFLLLSAISERVVALPQLEAFGSFWRSLVAISAIAVPLLVLVPLGAMLLRDLGRAFFEGAWGRRLQGQLPTRAQGVLVVGATIGLWTSYGFYPELSRQLSPKEVFERYRELGRPGEPLGMLGQDNARARYQSGSSTAQLADVGEAFAWLTAEGVAGRRRWLVLGKAELGPLNALMREQHFGNVPILDARSSEVLLASNRRARGERDESPLAAVVLDAAPPPQHPLHAVLGERQLELLGFSITSPLGRLETELTPTTRYRFIIYWRVLEPLKGEWLAFVHLDGLQRRYNADHELVEGKYPLPLWREGDVLADATDLELEPNFSPGQYRVYLGLYSGERRLPVTEGPGDDDRIAAGTVSVR